MKTCRHCGKKAENRFFFRFDYGSEMCVECWQQRIKDIETLAKRYDTETGLRIK